jgi:hypothetical protein
LAKVWRRRRRRYQAAGRVRGLDKAENAGEAGEADLTGGKGGVWNATGKNIQQRWARMLDFLLVTCSLRKNSNPASSVYPPFLPHVLKTALLTLPGPPVS